MKGPSSVSGGNGGVYATGNGNGKAKAGQGVSVNVMNAEAETMLKAAAAVFGDLVEELGPPLKPLVVCCHALRISRCILLTCHPEHMHRRYQTATREFCPQTSHRI